ncbi:MAG: hypothetical protein H6721_17155 [Sandaracinus sp.]|nr:hypothetical protein [Myxococcales bacterium]MCB9612712.1 hypothetical protein [Sandaracinus sp.]MCB9625002.1 hypothetical protein [Sandaracinus sp.]MCB9633849.1 hypothetical protein [Sandaracinus sp.]
MTYRDARLALRERFRDASDRRARGVATLAECVARVRAREDELTRSGVPLVFRVPDPPFSPLEAPADDATLEAWEGAIARVEADLLEIADEGVWLEGREDALRLGVDRAPLAPPPRDVPLRLVLAEWLGVSVRSGWVAFPMAMFARGLGGRLGAMVAAGVFALVTVAWTWRCIGFLRHGVMATTRLISHRVTGTKMTNWPVRRARGWAVDVVSHTGAGNVWELAAFRDGEEGAAPTRLLLRNVLFDEGVVLLRGGKAMATVSLGSGPMPTPEGRWARRLGAIGRRNVAFGLVVWTLFFLLVRF